MQYYLNPDSIRKEFTALALFNIVEFTITTLCIIFGFAKLIEPSFDDYDEYGNFGFYISFHCF